MPKINIKASNIANLTDARYFAAMLVDFLEFQLDLSHDERLSSIEYHGIKAWVEGPKIVAQVGKTPKDLFQEVYKSEDYDLINCALDNPHYPANNTIYTYSPTSFQELSHQAFDPQRIYHLDTQHIPEDTLYQGALLQELCAQQSIFISAPNNEGYIRQLIEDIRPYGIDVKGGAEEKVGFKSYEELDVFFEHLEIYS